MYDVDFLLGLTTSLNRPVVYFYGGGDLRHQMQRSLEAVVAPTQLFHVPRYAIRFGNGLLGGVLFCDARELGRARDRDNLLSTLSDLIKLTHPGILFIPGECDSSLRTHIEGSCLLIEELPINETSIARALELLVSTTDLLSDPALFQITSLYQHFEDFLQRARQPCFAEVRHEFERVMLLFVNAKTGEFLHTQAGDELNARSIIAQPLRKLVLHREEPAITELICGLENRNPSATMNRHFRELLAQTRRLSYWIFRDGAPEHIALIRLAVWSSVLLKSLKSDSPAGDGSAAIDQVAREYLLRSSDSLLSQPIDGLWTSLTEPAREFEGDIALRHELLTALQTMKRYPFAWLSRWHSCLRDSLERNESDAAVCVSPTASVHTISFSSIIGQENPKAALTRRCFSGEHAIPLVLCGPDGVGKKALARAYARSSLCREVDGLTADACGVCSSCRWFDAGAIVHELDARSADASDHMRNVLLRISKIGSVWGRHVVIMDHAAENLFLLNMCMKTLERQPAAMRFIFLVEDIEEMDLACSSRCERYYLSPLTSTQMDDLIDSHPELMKQKSVKVLLKAISAGLPGEFYSSLQKLKQSEVASLEAALRVFGLDWGAEACALLGSAIRGEMAAMDQLFEQKSAVQQVEHFTAVMAAIYEHHYGEAITTPALLHLESDIHQLTLLIQDNAKDLGVDFLDIWNEISERLCDHDRGASLNA